MSHHIILTRKLFETNRTRVVLNIGFVRCYIVATKIAYVGVSAMANSTPINVALFNAEIPNRSFCSFALNLKRSLEVALANFRLTAADQIEYGTAH